MQARTLVETLPIDADDDGFLSTGELEASRDSWIEYVEPRFHLRVSGSDGLELEGLERLVLVPGGGFELPWVEMGLRYGTDASIEEIEVEHRLFLEQNPGHTDFAQVRFGDEEPRRVLFGNGYHTELFRAARLRRGGVVLDFGRLGVEHILTGYDHLAFLLVLLVASRALTSLLGVVTAFTAAHSVTLALAALDVVRLPSRFVELCIALSIAYVACDNLLRRTGRTPWIEAFGFGLLHGFGFAGFLGEAVAGEPLVVSALLGFNLGVEVGQIAVVLVLTAVTLVLARITPSAPASDPDTQVRDPSLAPAWLRYAASSVVALFGFYWFVERAGWIR